VLDFESNDTTFDTKDGMEKYRRTDIDRLRKFLDDLKDSKPKRTHLVNMTKVTNLMSKIGFIEYKQSGSKRPFYHELLQGHPHYEQGRILISEAQGKRDMTRWANFEDYVLDAVEYVLERIDVENLILEDDENVQI
jgi:hypothetical protein